VQVVGLAKTSKYIGITEPPTEFVYFPYTQRSSQRMALLTESTDDPSSLVAPLRGVVRSLDPDQPIVNIRTMAENYRMRQLVIVNVVTRLIGAMGMMGLALAFIGLYGLVAYAASRRTKEIGIRLTIGARRSDVLRMVLRQGMVIAVLGLGVDLVARVAVAPALAAVVPGGGRSDGRIDVVAFLLVAATVLALTLVAAYVPARRASRVDPTEVLRCE
jgi:predicted lysophospholipase L1 biosynthesis ABC-type transport system permease subunit